MYLPNIIIKPITDNCNHNLLVSELSIADKYEIQKIGFLFQGDHCQVSTLLKSKYTCQQIYDELMESIWFEFSITSLLFLIAQKTK